jgi:hypothetical protein
VEGLRKLPPPAVDEIVQVLRKLATMMDVHELEVE